MELGNLFRIIWRWSWLVGSVVLVTMLVLMFRLRATPAVYEAQVQLQLTAPQQEDVDLFDRYRSISARDELAVMRNNFTEVIKSREVFDRTIKQLGLEGKDAEYELDINPLRDSDFIYVVVRARTAELAATIANGHVEAAIEYLGEVRAQPTTAVKNLLSIQLRTAEEKVSSAQEAFTEFKIRNNISTMDGEIAIYQSLIDKLQSERNQRLIEGPTSWEIQRLEALIEQLSTEREHASAEGNTVAMERFDAAITNYSTQLQDLRKTTNATANVDRIIQSRRDELAHLVLLAPTYDQLNNDLIQARKDRDLILSKYTEATLKESTVKSSSFMQVIEAAEAPTQAVPKKQGALLVLGLVASLGLGLMLAFLLDYLLSRTSVRLAVEPYLARLANMRLRIPTSLRIKKSIQRGMGHRNSKMHQNGTVFKSESIHRNGTAHASVTVYQNDQDNSDDAIHQNGTVHSSNGSKPNSTNTLHQDPARKKRKAPLIAPKRPR